MHKITFIQEDGNEIRYPPLIYICIFVSLYFNDLIPGENFEFGNLEDLHFLVKVTWIWSRRKGGSCHSKPWIWLHDDKVKFKRSSEDKRLMFHSPCLWLQLNSNSMLQNPWFNFLAWVYWNDNKCLALWYYVLNIQHIESYQELLWIGI